MAEYDDKRSHDIAVSIGVKAAGDAAARQPDPLRYFTANAAKFAGVVLDTIATLAFEKVNNIMPGTTVSDVGPGVIVPAAPQTAPTAPVGVPTAIPWATDGDPQVAAIWQEFFADFKTSQFNQWYDNRQNKRSAKGPDFKNKADGDKALWIVGKKNPSWVPTALAQVGLV